jgi:radical SAM superfamily enzyme YgiQ (UPF0313 family)
VGSILPPLGLCSLAAIAREAGHRVEMVDCYAEKLTAAQAAERLVPCKPDCIGISATTEEIIPASKLAAILRNRLPDTPIILGGVHVTSLPEATLERFPQFSLAVLGEAEATFPELLAALAGKMPLNDVAGLAIRTTGGISRTSPRPFLADLDALPLPAFDLLPDLATYYTPAITNYRTLPASGLVTSRGCPGQCTFCDRTVFGNHLRMLSAPRILEQMRLLRDRYGMREICFYDDTLVAHRSRLEELCNLLIAEPLGISWSCNARVNLVTPELLQLMGRAGCWQIAFGLESGDQELLDRLCKGISLAEGERAVQWAREAGLAVRAFFIIGLPGETTETLRRTEEYALRLPLDDIILEFFTPFPGTELYTDLLANGISLPDWGAMNTYCLSYVPKTVRAEELETAFKRIIRRFYLRPRIVYGYLSRFRNPVTIWRLARSFVSFLVKG